MSEVLFVAVNHDIHHPSSGRFVSNVEWSCIRSQPPPVIHKIYMNLTLQHCFKFPFPKYITPVPSPCSYKTDFWLGELFRYLCDLKCWALLLYHLWLVMYILAFRLLWLILYQIIHDNLCEPFLLSGPVTPLKLPFQKWLMIFCLIRIQIPPQCLYYLISVWLSASQIIVYSWIISLVHLAWLCMVKVPLIWETTVCFL